MALYTLPYNIAMLRSSKMNTYLPHNKIYELEDFRRDDIQAILRSHLGSAETHGMELRLRQRSDA
ncbi:hypothetical protein HDF16_003559 [Granulicella aggregans]|uniref:Uncharacterized protein n=1 Tax=Granulicella aggregans TaxID=474949 RepID=A0A7W7ZFF2_9BACT|nr:hypothetical protein [Granulicella aggregans]